MFGSEGTQGQGSPFDFDAFFKPGGGDSGFHHQAHFNFHEMFEDFFDNPFGDMFRDSQSQHQSHHGGKGWRDMNPNNGRNTSVERFSPRPSQAHVYFRILYSY